METVYKKQKNLKKSGLLINLHSINKLITAMKKFFYPVVAALAVLSALSCGKNDVSSSVIIIDGVSYNTFEAWASKRTLENGGYNIIIDFGEKGENHLAMTCDAEFDGKSIDLTKKPDNKDMYWTIDAWMNGKDLFYATMDDFKTNLFDNGTLRIDKLGEGSDSADFKIVLKDGKIKDSDGVVHTVEVKFNGPIKLVAGFE